MKWLIAALLLLPFTLFAQTPFKGNDYIFYYQMNVGKGNGTSTTASAWLEIGKDSTTKALRMPRVVDTANVASPVFGLAIYQIKDNGIYFRDKFGWRRLTDAGLLSTYLQKSDSTTFYYPLKSNPKNYVITELDPSANAKTIRWIPGAGMRVSNSAPQALSTNPSDSIVAKVDSAIWNANRLQTAPISATAPTSGQILQYNGSQYVPVTFGGGGGGSVTSVGLSMPGIFTVTNSPVITSGTLTATLNNQFANLVLASPNGVSGAPVFRGLVNGDLPNSAVSSGNYGNDTAFTTFTVNSKGVLSNATTVPLTLDRALRGNNSTNKDIRFTDTSKIVWNISSEWGGIQMFTNGNLNSSTNMVFTVGDDSYYTPSIGSKEGFIFQKDTSQHGGFPPYLLDTIIKINDVDVTFVNRNRALPPLMFWNRLTNKIGIGTAAPAEALDIAGNVVATAPTYSTGGITSLGRNNTTGRFETFTPTAAGPASVKGFNTNATAADTLYAYTVSPTYLTNNGDVLKMTYAGNFSAAAGTDHAVGLALGGTSIAGLSNGVTSGGSWEIECTVIRVSNTTIRATTRIVFDNFGVTTNLYLHTTSEVTGLNLTSNGLRTGLYVGSPNVNVTATMGTITYYPAAL